jgi:hypothetical protein
MNPAILYGAKTSEDKHGSIDSNRRRGRELAAREQRTVIFEDHDQGFSAYSGNRGDGLKRCKGAATGAAAEHGVCLAP